ncbi:MAG TPA: Lrp/AsnC family transcriptional regulator [Acidimicrobiia bacterium]
MDRTDRKIVGALLADARRHLSQIAEEIGVATSTVHQRVKRLEETGTIKGSRVLVDWVALGYPVLAMLSAQVTGGGLGDAANAFMTVPCVQSCWAITGEFDLMLVVRARSSAHLGEIIEQLRTLAPIRTRTTVVLNTFFEGRFPPLEA